MANTQRALDILDGDSGESGSAGTGSGDTRWKSVEDILYQPIVITRANVRDNFDTYSQKNKTYAYVNFYHFDDESQTEYAFRTAWPALRAQIAGFERAKRDGDNPYPVECGVVELLIDNPLVGEDGMMRFPVKLAPFDALEAAALAATAYSLNLNQSATVAPTAPPANHETPAGAASNVRASTTAATAGKRSAPISKPGGR